MKLFVFGIILGAFALTSCATTKPPSPPISSFTGGTFECTLQTVADERPKADGIVGDCLVLEAEPVSKCLDALTSWYSPDTIACSVRSQGMHTATKIAKGGATDRDRFIFAGAKSWINREGVSFR